MQIQEILSIIISDENSQIAIEKPQREINFELVQKITKLTGDSIPVKNNNSRYLPE